MTEHVHHVHHVHLFTRNIAFRSEVRELGSWRYVMCPAPDDVLLELFEVEGEQLDPALADYFLGPGWRSRSE